MPSREQIAAALKYMGDKANLRQRFERATSLDPQEQDMADIAVETAASFVPGVGQALAARDVERARRANDPAGMAMASMGAIPGGRLAKLLKRYDPVMQQLDVYHGTPHKFPATETNPLGEFDASKIGTGEGAQAYGHGVYLAESPRVAEDYRRSTSRSRFLTDNGYFDPSELEHLHVKVKARHGNIDEAIETAKKYVIPDEDYPEVAAKAARDLQKLEALKARGGYRENPGALYKADLPDEMIDRMLDWDKPIKDQPEAVRKAIDRIESEFSMRKQPYKDQEGTGFWYGALTDTVGGQQNASKLLKEYGVPGIKYADAGSRGQGGSGTRNFVVFPGEEKKVRILERK